jgi:hypothetical protein
MAVTLNQDVEEVMGEVWKYMEGLAKARSQEQHLDAAEDAVKSVEGEARAAVCTLWVKPYFSSKKPENM